MNLTKYITLNIIALISNISVILLVIDSIVELPIFDNWLYYLSFCYIVGIILHILFILEVMIRIKKPEIIPEFKVSKNIKIIHGILFYIGWLIALSVIILLTLFIIDVQSSDFNRYLKPIPFDTTLD